MRFFLSFSPEHGTEVSAADALEGHVRQAGIARDGGLHGVSVGQHLSIQGMQWFPPFSLLSYVARHCAGMELATGTTIASFFEPVELAEQTAFLDNVSGGRFTLGISAGYNAAEFRALGVDRRTRLQRLKTMVILLPRLWTEDHVTFEDELYSLQDVTLSLRPLHRPAMWLGATGPKTVQAVAGLGDALVMSSHLPLTDLVGLKESYDRARAAAGAGAAAEVPVLRNVYVSTDRRTALDEIAPFIGTSYRQYQSSGFFEHSDQAQPLRVEDRFIFGSPDDVAVDLRALESRLGATTVLLRMQWGSMPSSMVEQSLHRFIGTVLPAFRP